jgi:hypothetical protein
MVDVGKWDEIVLMEDPIVVSLSQGLELFDPVEDTPIVTIQWLPQGSQLIVF